MTLAALSAQLFTLPLGTLVAIRALQPSDAGRLHILFDRLSVESRFNRFHAHFAVLTPAMCQHLSNVDHEDRAALVAFDGGDVLEASPIAVARFHRLDGDGRPDAAELAITVVDDFQRRGLGTLMLEELAAMARDRGITKFVAHTLAANRGMLRLLASHGAVRTPCEDHELSFELATAQIHASMQPPATQLVVARTTRARIRSRGPWRAQPLRRAARRRRRHRSWPSPI